MNAEDSKGPLAHTQDEELIDNILYHIDARQPTPPKTQVRQPASAQVQVLQSSPETARGRDNSLTPIVKREPSQDESDLSSPTPRLESQSSQSPDPYDFSFTVLQTQDLGDGSHLDIMYGVSLPSTSQEVTYASGEETGVESDDLLTAVYGRRVKAEAQLRPQFEPGNETPAAVESTREYSNEKPVVGAP
ncbi:hypothetical protein EDD21DRAFT_351888 [Dissophora ornata]|nr:hypothetical protein EDD21DRAFT_351888 [Dissophora ornata]